MLRKFFSAWADWTGDHYLTLAIHRELRRHRLAVHASQTRDVRLIAIQRPGWVQVRSFTVETRDADKQPVTVLGLARDDGRESRIEVVLTTDPGEFSAQREQWSAGLVRRGRW